MQAPCGIIWRHRRPGRQVGDPYKKGSYMIPFNEQLYSVDFGRLAGLQSVWQVAVMRQNGIYYENYVRYT